VFATFRVGQPFEAVVSRHPTTFRIIRADAVRKLRARRASEEQSKALWDRVIGSGEPVAESSATEVDEGFWLQPPE